MNRTSTTKRPATTHRPRTRGWKIAGRAGSCILALVVLVAGGLELSVHHLQGNVKTLNVTRELGTDRPPVVAAPGPTKPVNILVMGSDTRTGLNGAGIGGTSGGLSDTTILLHLSANRKFAYGVSLPRDAMVERPKCTKADGSVVPGAFSQFNEAYELGGPGCTVRTVEQLTGVHIDHFAVVDFHGFRGMVDALGGVKVCVPNKVVDTIGHITMPAGTYKVNGLQALNYVRERHGIGDGSDIGRMKRQQAFVASLIHQVLSAGTLTQPWKLYGFLNAMTKSITVDPGLKALSHDAALASSLKNIGMNHIKFITVPWLLWPQDHNRLVWAPQAQAVWARIIHDRPLTPDMKTTAVNASATPGAHPNPRKTNTHPTGPSGLDKSQAATYGLCT